ASQSCCPALGADACGAGLFCAAFDGRDVATCYVEHTRLDMAECSTDVQCLSASCNLDVRHCRSLPGQTCTTAIGCATAPNGERYACDTQGYYGDEKPFTCRLVDPTIGGVCGTDDDCRLHHCVDSRCTSGIDGDPCAKPADCDGGHCVGGTCASGTMGG